MQWRSSSEYENAPEQFLDGMERYVEMSIDDSDSYSDSSIEELTTIKPFDTITETNPPIINPTAPTLEESFSPLLMKLVSFETTESTMEILTEVPVVTGVSKLADKAEKSARKSAQKSIKPRLLDTKTEELILKPEHRDDETFESIPEEDTTTIAEIDSDLNETNIDIAEDDTTIQPPTSKKPKKIEIYKTRPNELLRHYVEDSHLRSPVAALIDKKTNPLAKAKKLWKAALKPNALLDIMVVSYDSEGELNCFVVKLFWHLIHFGFFFLSLQESKALTT